MKKKILMAEKTTTQQDNPSKSVSDSESSDKETNPRLQTSVEERLYNTIRGSPIATKITLSHSTTQTNPTVERGSDHNVKIKKLPKEKAKDETTQTDTKDKSK